MVDTNKYRARQRSLGRKEIRGIFCDDEHLKPIKLHIKHILRLIGEGETHDDIYNRLARSNMEN